MGTRTDNDMLAVTTAAAVKRISWVAVFAGVILAMVVQLSLSLLGAGIGISTVDPVQGETLGAKALGLGAGIWWAIVAQRTDSRPVLPVSRTLNKFPIGVLVTQGD